MSSPSARARVGVALAQIAAVLVAVFVLTSLLPGDTAVVIAGEHATEERLAALRAELGLDLPAHQRFLDWCAGLLTGDLGTSLLTGEPVADKVARGWATTAVLALCTLAIVLPAAIAIGVVSGLRQGSLLDRGLNLGAVTLNAVPEFAFGLLLVGVFSLQAGWLPATGGGASGWSLLAEPAVLVLPVAVLAAKQVCGLARQIRIGVAEAHGAAYVRHVRLLGMPERTVVFRHVLPNAMRPAVQQGARTVDGLLGGVVVVEALFALPGLGSDFVRSVQGRDLPAIQGYALVFAATTVTVNLAADLLSRRIGPRQEAPT